MAWSDAARQAAAEARRRKSHVTVSVMEAGTGHHSTMTRQQLAAHTRSVRAILRNKSTSKGRRRLYSTQLSNNRYAAKKARVY